MPPLLPVKGRKGRRWVAMVGVLVTVIAAMTVTTRSFVKVSSQGQPPVVDTWQDLSELNVTRAVDRSPRNILRFERQVSMTSLPHISVDGPSAEIIAVRSKVDGECRTEGRRTRCESRGGITTIIVQVVVRRPAEMPSLEPRCSDAATESDDAVEMSIESSVALLTPHRPHRVATKFAGRVALYEVVVDVLDSANYELTVTVRFFCGAQLTTFVKASPGPIDKAQKPYPAWVQRWKTLGLQADLAARWASSRCVVDETLTWSSRAGRTGGWHLVVILGAAPPTMPPCHASTAFTIFSIGSPPGRWVNLRRLFNDGERTKCSAPYCSGDFTLLWTEDQFSSNDTFSKGWVYVPSQCQLEFPATADDAWGGFDNRVVVLLGDSTTSDTLYHLLRYVFRSSSNPPRNRWSDPFEMAVKNGKNHRFVLRQQRIGNMERDRASGWFDNLRGLEFFHAPFQQGKLREWLSYGRSVVGRYLPALTLQKGVLAVDSSRDARKSDVEATADSTGQAVTLDGNADIVIVHSGPHDRRRPGHTERLFTADVQHMKTIVAAFLDASKGSRKSPALIWRGNVVGAGPYYACSRLENPWIYRAMDDVASRLLHGDDGWFTIDVASLTHAFHWTLTHSDGIHYGRYQQRYRKQTLVDRTAAVMLWNVMAAHLRKPTRG